MTVKESWIGKREVFRPRSSSDLDAVIFRKEKFLRSCETAVELQVVNMILILPVAMSAILLSISMKVEEYTYCWDECERAFAEELMDGASHCDSVADIIDVVY